MKNVNKEKTMIEPRIKYNDYGIFYVNENDDLHIGYILCIPKDIKDGAKLVLESNIGEYKIDNEDYIKQSIVQAENIIEEFKGTGAPILIPILPESEFQELDRDCFNDEVEQEYKNIHNHVYTCIQDSKNHIEKITKKKIQDTIFVNGSGKSALFAQRFALLKPECVDSICISGNITNFSRPIEKYKGEVLNFPEGIADFKELIGEKFNYEAYKKIKLLYIGTNLDDIDKKNLKRSLQNAEFKEFDGSESLDPRIFYNDRNYYKEKGFLHKIASKIKGFLEPSEQQIYLLTSGTNTEEKQNTVKSLDPIDLEEFEKKHSEISKKYNTAEIAKDRLNKIKEQDEK